LINLCSCCLNLNSSYSTNLTNQKQSGCSLSCPQKPTTVGLPHIEANEVHPPNNVLQFQLNVVFLPLRCLHCVFWDSEYFGQYSVQYSRRSIFGVREIFHVTMNFWEVKEKFGNSWYKYRADMKEATETLTLGMLGGNCSCI